MRVFLADDRAWLRSVLRLLLEQAPNMEVVGEFDQADCLPRFVEVLHPDLVVLDWDLPGLNTIGARKKLIAALRTVQPHVYVLVLYGSSRDRCLPLTSGADAFVNTVDSQILLLEALDHARQVTGKTCQPLV